MAGLIAWPLMAHAGALKQSLSNATPPPAAPPTAMHMTNPQWIDLSLAQRTQIVRAWQALPETTRPVFPAYLDQVLEKRPGSHPAPRVAHATLSQLAKQK